MFSGFVQRQSAAAADRKSQQHQLAEPMAGQQSPMTTPSNSTAQSSLLVSSALSSFVQRLRTCTKEQQRREELDKLAAKLKKGSNSRFERSILLLKILYVRMYGLDTSWAHFEATKLLGMDTYSTKRRAYLYMECCFHSKMDAAMMSFNTILRDLRDNTKLIPLTINTMALIMNREISEMVFNLVKFHTLHSNDELKQKSATLLVQIAKINENYPAKHIFDMASALTLTDGASKLFVFVSIILELKAHFPDARIDFAPALLKILKSRITDIPIASKIFILMKKLCKTDEKLLKKIKEFILQQLVPDVNICLFSDMLSFIIMYRDNFTEPIVEHKIISAFKRHFNSKDVNVLYITVKMLNKYHEICPFEDSEVTRLVSGLMAYSDRQMIIETVKYITRIVTPETVFQVISSLIKIMKSTKSDFVAGAIFDQVIFLCTNNDYHNLMRNADLLKWYSEILISVSRFEKNINPMLIVEQLKKIIGRCPEVSALVVQNLEELIYTFKVKRRPSITFEDSTTPSSETPTTSDVNFIANVIDIASSHCVHLKSLAKTSQKIIQLAPAICVHPSSLTLVKISLLRICLYSQQLSETNPTSTGITLRDAILQEFENALKSMRNKEINPFHFNLGFACSVLDHSLLVVEEHANDVENAEDIELPDVLKEFMDAENEEEKSSESSHQAKSSQYRSDREFLVACQSGNELKKFSDTQSNNQSPNNIDKHLRNLHVPSNTPPKAADDSKQHENSLKTTFDQLAIQEEANRKAQQTETIPQVNPDPNDLDEFKNQNMEQAQFVESETSLSDEIQ